MDEKADLLIRSAIHLFNAKGFHNTPTSAISRHAAVATGTLFHYFSTKEELINACYLACKDAMVRAMSSGLEGLETSAALKLSVQNFVRWGFGNPPMFQFARQFANSPLINNLARQEGEEKFGKIFTLLELAKGEGYLKPLVTDQILEIVMGIVTAFVQTARMIEPDELEASIQTASLVVLDALKA